VVGTVTQGGDRVQAGAVRLCTAVHGSALGIWDSACTVKELEQVVVAIVNMNNNKFELLSGNCVGSMSNSVFEADGGIYKPYWTAAASAVSNELAFHTIDSTAILMSFCMPQTNMHLMHLF
jgi:hypothetical protein